jgi:putative transposase
VRDTPGHDVVTKRRACRVLAQARNTQRRRASAADDEPQFLWMAIEYGRNGYRRISALPRADGWWVNHKRVERIWRQEGLKVPTKQPKRRRLWLVHPASADAPESRLGLRFRDVPKVCGTA